MRPTDLNKDFWTKAKYSNSGCLEWQANKDKDGYGRIGINLKTRRAHRIAWQITFGDIPKGLLVCHKCDNPCCINTDHLFLGTHKDNVLDCVNKKRTKEQKKITCKRGHQFDIFYTLKTGRPARKCSECGRLGQRMRRYKSNNGKIFRDSKYRKKGDTLCRNELGQSIKRQETAG